MDAIIITVPIKKIFGFGKPGGETPGMMIARAQCPCCERNTAAWWDRFFRGAGFTRILICASCGYWERS